MRGNDYVSTKDLVCINVKSTDYLTHQWNVNSNPVEICDLIIISMEKKAFIFM